jgi:transporter family protein
MWIVYSFVSALCLGFYDISKKIALRGNSVFRVLALSVFFSALLLSVPLLISRLSPQMMIDTPFYVPQLDLTGHLFTLLKSVIVLSSWVFAYLSLKQLPISVVSPIQATRPMWTLVGALLIFGERLNTWQWVGVILAIGSVFLFSFVRRPSSPRPSTSSFVLRPYIYLALAVLLGACSGLYDKYLMQRYDHNAVQVYYMLYQAVLMFFAFVLRTFAHRTSSPRTSYIIHRPSSSSFLAIPLISIFLVISDNVYMLALSDPDSLIAVVSTIRRGGAVIGFAYGLLFLKEGDTLRKIACMAGILAGLICLAMGSVG